MSSLPSQRGLWKRLRPLLFWIPLLVLVVLASFVFEQKFLAWKIPRISRERDQLDYAAMIAEKFHSSRGRWPASWDELRTYPLWEAEFGPGEDKALDWYQTDGAPPILVYWGEDRLPGGQGFRNLDVIDRSLFDRYRPERSRAASGDRTDR